MSAHTPGPWKLELGTNGEPHEIVRENGEQTVPCECPDCQKWIASGYSNHGNRYTAIVETDSHVYGPSLADAHLIAAAPDLLAALKELIHQAEDDVDDRRLSPAVMQAHEAVAKAEGRS